MFIGILFALVIGITFSISLIYGFLFLFLFFPVLKRHLFLVIIILFGYFYTSQFIEPSGKFIEGKVVESYDYGCIIQANQHYYFNYNDENYLIGTLVKGEIEEVKQEEGGNLNDFSFQNYLYSKKVFHIISFKHLTIKEKPNLKQKLISYLDSFQEPVNSYSKQLLFGLKDEYTKNLYDLTSSLSLLHLFALSGMHLTILEKWLKKLHIPESVIMFALGGYVYLVGNMLSLWRSYLYKLICYWSDLDPLNALALTGILLLLYNPYILLGSTFYFSMILSFSLEIGKKIKYHGFYIYLASIPLILYFCYELPLLGMLYIFICSGLVESIFSLLLVNCILIGKISFVIVKVIQIFENSLLFLNDYNLLLIFGKMPFLVILLYYLIYLGMMIHLQLNRKAYVHLFLLGAILTGLYFSNDISPVSEVTMLDVGQGDCLFIHLPFNKTNILIDTGGNYSKDLATKTIIPYLKSRGIRQLDEVIITHQDFDHNGSLESLLVNFPVKEVVEYGKDLGELHWIDTGYHFEENDRSLVYQLTLYGISYLFTGDLPKELEKIVVEQIDDIDILKVGHHGSNTSTSAYLLEKLSPEIGLIGVGKYNHFNHPNSEVLERLEAYHVKVFRTDLNGMIRIIQCGPYFHLQTKVA